MTTAGIATIENIFDAISPWLYPFVATCVIGLCTIASWLIYLRWGTKEFPPGPVGFPFLGYLPFLGGHLEQDFGRLADQYGDIFYLRIGQKDVVVLNSVKTIQDAFENQADLFCGRGDSFVLQQLWQKSSGILFSEGAKWTTFRAFAAKHLSQRMFAADLEIETHEFVSVLKTSMKEPRDARTFFLPIVANIAMQTVLEMRKPYIDEKFQSYIINFQKVSDLMHETSPMDLIPLMRIVPSQRRRLEVLKQKFQEKMDLIRSFIKESLSAEPPANFPRQFLKSGTESEDDITAGYFTEPELVMVVNDLWGASSEASASTLQWAVLYMMKYPGIQTRVQAELDKLGQPHLRLIKQEDRENLPFTTAVLMEVLRCASVAPFGVPRTNHRETILDGFVIPEKSIIIPNYWYLHRAPRYWKDPMEFQPERFLLADRTITKPDAFLPFSLGSRSCPFQDMALIQLFVIFANLLHRFKLVVPAGLSLPDDYVSALTVRPKDFSFVVEARYDRLLPNNVESHAA